MTAGLEYLDKNGFMLLVRPLAGGEKAGIVFSFLKRHCPAYAAELENRLARPVLFFGKYEYIALDGRFSNSANPQSRTAPEARDRPVSLEVPSQRAVH